MAFSRPSSFFSGAFWITPAIVLFGGLTALMGGTIVFQWLTHGTALIHIGPGTSVLHFNSSLSFTLGGIGLCALALGHRRIGVGIGIFLLALSGATLVEYLANVDLGIDQCVVRAYMTSNHAHPGRMSQITSTNWILIGSLFLVEGLLRPSSWRLVTTCFLSSLVLANNGMALIGYWIGLPNTYTWGIFHRVTLQTATGFCLLSAGLILFSLRNVSSGERRDARGLPLAAGLGIFTASLILWQVLLAGNRWQILNDMEAVRSTLGAQMIEQIDSRVRALERMGKRLETHPTGPSDFRDWQSDALLYIEHERVFRGIGRTDPDGKVVWWVHDESGLEPGPDGHLGTPAIQKEAREQAESGGSTVASDADRLGTSEATSDGFITWFPIYRNHGSTLDGYIAACFDVRQLLSRIDAGNGLDKFSFRVRDGERVLYQRGPFVHSDYLQTFPLDYLSLGWQVDIEPGALLLARENAHLAHLILVLGILFSGTLIFSLSGYQKARRQTAAVKAIETILRESEERYRLLVANVKDYAIFPLDAGGRISDWNAGAEKLHGYPSWEILGKDCSLFYAPEEDAAERTRQTLRTARDEGRVVDEGWRMRKDGSRFWANVTLTALRNEAGEIIGFSKITRDLTRQRETAALLAQRNADLEAAMIRVEEVSRLKSEFLSNMSHELRTPLNSVIGFSEFLRDQKPGPLNEAQQEYLDDVLNSANYLLQLINDLLDLAKIEAGRMELLLESFDLGTLAEETVSQLRPLLQKKNLVFTSRLEVGDVLLDPKKIRQVLNNLLSNAIKFTNPKGRIELSIVPSALDPARIEIAVRDSGIGIKPEDFDKLFGEFQQLDSGVSRRYQGSGLGLALTKKLVTLHGGEIRVESVFSMGSTFIVTLPRQATFTSVPSHAP